MTVEARMLAKSCDRLRLIDVMAMTGHGQQRVPGACCCVMAQRAFYFI